MKRQLLFLGIAATVFTASAIPPTVQGVPYKAKHHATADYEEPGPIPASEFDMNTIKFWAGEGSKKCAIVIQWCDDTEESALVFGYKWDGEATGAEAIKALVEEHPQVYGAFGSGQYGVTVGGIGFDPDGDGNFSITTASGTVVTPDDNGILDISEAACDGATPTNANDYFHGGWYDGYWSYWVSEPGSDEFTYSQVGASSRRLADGCIDGWMWAPGLQTSTWKQWTPAPAPKQQAWTGDMTFNERSMTFKVTDAENLEVALTQPSGTYYSNVVFVPQTITHEGTTFTVTSIDDQTFYYSGSVTDLYLPSSVTKIGNKAFNAIKNVTFQESVPPMCESNTFELAPDDMALHVPAEAVEAYQAAEGWKNYTAKAIETGSLLEKDGIVYRLDNFETPEVSVSFYPRFSTTDTWSNGTFYKRTVEVPASVSLMGRDFAVTGVVANAFNYDLELERVILPETVRTIGKSAFNNSTIKEMNIPAGVTAIPDNCFDNCASLQKVTGMENVTEIGALVFNECKALTELEGMGKMKTLGNFAFASCEGITEFPEMPELSLIGNGAFSGCHALKYVCLPSTINKITEIFSQNVSGPVVVYNCGSEPFSLSGIHSFSTSFFYDSSKPISATNPLITRAPIYVPYGCKNAYTSDMSWNLSEIRELTPVGRIAAQDVQVTGKTATFTADFANDGIVETDVPQLFLDANDFSSFATALAAGASLEYRVKDAEATASVIPFADGATATAEVALEPGDYEYRWTAPQASLAGEWMPFTIDVSTGIDDMEATDAAIEYYTLEGLRVERPANGIYLQRKGNKTRKIIIR